MPVRTRITRMARQRGLTAAEVARRLRLYPSNVSAMDAGRRSPSLRLLGRIAHLLACHPGELLEVHRDPQPPLFRRHRAHALLEQRQRQLTDGAERGWVHTALLAWQRHYLPRTRQADRP